MVADGKFVELTHDLNLLASLGVRLVLVHGARPQIEQHLLRNQMRLLSSRIRLTDAPTMQCVKEARRARAFRNRGAAVDGADQSPMANADIRVRRQLRHRATDGRDTRCGLAAHRQCAQD